MRTRTKEERARMNINRLLASCNDILTEAQKIFVFSIFEEYELLLSIEKSRYAQLKGAYMKGNAK